MKERQCSKIKVLIKNKLAFGIHCRKGNGKVA